MRKASEAAKLGCKIVGSLKFEGVRFGLKYPQFCDDKRTSTTPESMMPVEKIPAAVTAVANTKLKADKDKADVRGEDLPRPTPTTP
jgi:hypothetical protein